MVIETKAITAIIKAIIGENGYRGTLKGLTKLGSRVRRTIIEIIDMI